MIVIGALIGAGMGGPLGAAIGGGLGWWLHGRLRRSVAAGIGGALGGVQHLQQQFVDSTFAVMGALCKADGQVTHDEIRVVEALFDKLRLHGDRREAAKQAFRRGKAPGFDVEAEVHTFTRITHGNRAFNQIFLQLLLSVIAADGVLHPAEHAMLLHIASALGLSDAELARLESMLGVSGGGRPRQTSAEALAAAYTLLGVGDSASDAEVKRAYRKLMSENHPDKLAARGMPESMREMANEKTAQISTAYEQIKLARGMA